MDRSASTVAQANSPYSRVLLMTSSFDRPLNADCQSAITMCSESEQQFVVTKLLFARNFFRSEADVFVRILLCHTLVSLETTSSALAYRLLKAVARKVL